AGSAGPRARDALRREKAHAHGVDEAVVAVAGVEDALPADGRDADGVAVRADPGHGTAERVVRRAEAEAVQKRDRPGAHRHDVAQDPAHAGGCALERLDSGRVVVALDLERDRFAFAEVDHAGVLPRPLEHTLAARREPPEEWRRVVVAAVLRPEEREDRELEVVRIATHELLDPRELPIREPERAVQRR